MKRFYYVFLLFVALLTTSCDKSEIPSQSLGEVSYYPKFLFWDADTVSLSKTLELDFNQDAKDEGTRTSAEFAFVDNDGNPISPQELEIKVNDVVSPNNRFVVDATQSEVKLTFTFLPTAKPGKHQGNLTMVRHTLLDRVDNQIVQGSQPIDILKWTIYYDRNMNPLMIILLCLLGLILLMLFTWFVFLQPPHFKKFRKSVLVEKDGKIVNQFNCEFTGCHKVIFTTATVQQSIWNRIFVGRIKSVVNPLFTQPLTFTAKRRGNTATAFGIGYEVKSNPVPKSGITIIDNYQDKIKITLR